MGYIKHDTVIVTSWQIAELEVEHEKAKELFGEMCSDIVDGIANGQASFFIAPDGSKEGWSDSIECDEKRAQFLSWMRERNSFSEYVHLRFGGDDDQITIMFGRYEERD